jgi:hypothetical protein
MTQQCGLLATFLSVVHLLAMGASMEGVQYHCVEFSLTWPVAEPTLWAQLVLLAPDLFLLLLLLQDRTDALVGFDC